MDDQVEAQPVSIIELAGDIVSAYVSNNNVPVTELAGVIASVHATLSSLTNGAPAEPAGPEKLTPAQIKQSIGRTGIVSFEDGKIYQTLKRHLSLRGLTPETYRAKYGLPANYPMTSAAYSARRSELAHAAGLGQQRRKFNRNDMETPEVAPRAKGRKKAAETA